MTVAWRRGALPAAAVGVGCGEDPQPPGLLFRGGLGEVCGGGGGQTAWRWERGGDWAVGACGRGLPGLLGGFAFRLRGSRPCRLLSRPARAGDRVLGVASGGMV